MMRTRAWLRLFYRKSRRRLGMEVLTFAVWMWPDLWQAKVGTAAAVAAKIHIENYLTRQGIMHCCVCMDRFPLVKISGQFYCSRHGAAVQHVIKNKNGRHAVATGG